MPEITDDVLLIRDGQITPRDPKLSQKSSNAERVSFIDANGLERGVNPRGAEVIVTDEIQKVATEHFIHVEETLANIKKQIEEVKELSTNPNSVDDMFDPFDDEYLTGLLDRARAQIDNITQKETFTETVATERRGWLGLKKSVTEEVERVRTVLKPGKSNELSPQTLRTLKYTDQMIGQSKPGKRPTESSVETVDESVVREKATLIKVVEGLLIGEAGSKFSNMEELQIPLLAARLFSSGVDLDQLSIEKLRELVPEVEPLLERVDVFRKALRDTLIFRKIDEIGNQFYDIRPDKALVTALFYSDQDLDAIMKLYKETRTLATSLESEGGMMWMQEDEFEKEMFETIEHFFDDKVSGDTVVFHGTPALPRIIDSGAIIPGHKMTKENRPFTFFTRRAGTGMGVDGSRGVHWSGKPGKAYVADGYQNLDGYYKDEEKRKGDLAGGFVAIRVGDAIRTAPYIEGPDISAEAERNRLDRTSTKSIGVELTEAGYSKIASQLQRFSHSDDIVFAGTTSDRPSNELFNHEFPLDDLLIAVNEDDRELVFARLHKAGWEEKKIKERVVIIPRDQKHEQNIRSQEEVAQLAVSHPKFPRTVIVGLNSIAIPRDESV